MSYSAYLKPRKETISDAGIEGIIDLANLASGDPEKIEPNPEIFYSLTYPTSDTLRVLEQIHLRFQSNKDTSGLFLFEGLKGSGKSHLLLLVYNLFKHPDISRRWLSSNDITCNVPDDVIVVINKFTDNPYDSVWGMIFNALGTEAWKGKTHPGLAEFEKALGGRRLVLIFDELEQGIKVIANPALQAQNIAFLQMLSEYSNRSDKVTLFASIYSDREEPGSTLKRVPRCTVQFDNTQDRCKVILHRLFENYLSFNPETVSPVIESYVQLWKRHAVIDDEESFKRRFRETYPFTPSIMDILLKRIPSRGSFQNVRGSLAFLGNIVRLTHETNDIITPADASIEDKANMVMLRDIDISGDIINRAKENVEELKAAVPASGRLASAVLLYTITGLEANKGVTKDGLMPDMLSPSFDINSFNHTLLTFQKYASFFHSEGDRYFFDIEEQPEAKVELKSLKYSDDHARELLTDLIKTEVFRETSGALVFNSVGQTQEILRQMDKSRLRYVLAGRRLTQEERHNIYFGMEYRNLIILLEPKDDKFQLLNDKDLLKWAKRVLSAKSLADGAKKSSQKADYERIARGDQGNILDRIRKAGIVFISWENYGSSVNEDRVELEQIAGDCSKDKVIEALSQQFFPLLTFREHLEDRLEEIKGKLVKETDEEYKKTLSFPVPAMARAVSGAVRELCRDGVIGIQHSRGNFCGRYIDLTETEFFNAKITAPFPSDAVPKPVVCQICGQMPCACARESVSCHRCGQFPCICDVPPAGTCPRCGQRPCTCPKKKTIPLRITPQTDALSLRNQIAFRLQEYDGAEITKATYKIFFQKDGIGDMGTLPALLRGNLSGQGDVTAEISITKNGRFVKNQIEQQVESLPSISGADYSADLIVITENKEG
ncbi:MAG: hypothetical protein IT393_10370 [Nitrospirae bacterium]|nr:hypothetical protein [Nitrospirota bacterium]